jgi:hypothetical protein
MLCPDGFAKWPSPRQSRTREVSATLAVFLPRLAIQALVLVPKFDVILLGDGAVAVAGWLIKLFYRNVPVVCLFTRPRRYLQVEGLPTALGGTVFAET